jgi:ATP adenylyltransferase
VSKPAPPSLRWLWAPWRIPYLRRLTKREGRGRGEAPCFFCAYAGTPRRDRKNLVVHRGRACFVLLNRFPYQGGHLMVAPYAHQGDLARFDETERAETFDLLVLAQRVLAREMGPQGFNIGLNVGRPAGAGVPGHLHFHVVPRWIGDTNFMTSTSAVKVVPQALEELCGELQKAFRKGR